MGLDLRGGKEVNERILARNEKRVQSNATLEMGLPSTGRQLFVPLRIRALCAFARNACLDNALKHNCTAKSKIGPRH
jgi:hypothetical protein